MLHVQNPTPKDMWTWQGDNDSRILVRKIVLGLVCVSGYFTWNILTELQMQLALNNAGALWRPLSVRCGIGHETQTDSYRFRLLNFTLKL